MTSPPTRSGSRLVEIRVIFGHSAQHRGGNGSALPDDLFAVVDDDDTALGGQHLDQGLGRVLTRLLDDPKVAQHFGSHQRRVVYRRQLHQPHPVRTLREQGPSDFDGQPSLADSAGTSERHQSVAVKELDHLTDFDISADEAGQRFGQIGRVAHPAGVLRPDAGSKWRKGEWNSFHRQLKDLFRSIHVLEAVRTQVDQVHSRRKAVTDDLGGRPSHDDLAAVGSGLQSCNAVHCRSEVVTISLFALSGVESNTYPEGYFIGPYLGMKGTLCFPAAATASLADAKAAQKASPTVLKT